MRNNIPMEIRQLPHWVCAGPDKVPLSPRTGQPASVTDPNTWATYEEAIRTGMKHIGFVLTEWDPYTIIDLDNKPSKPCTPEQWARHQKILEAFDSYTERSASGTGYHIIVKGRIPAGVHRDNVEVYSSSRYMICTGDVVRNSPIADYQQLLDILYGEMKPADTVELEDRSSVLEDAEVVEMAMRAANGDKFNQLCAGEWEAMGYESQSEADFALLSIFAYYTLDNEQVRRLFRMSKLGQREKAIKNDRYLNFALGKIRAQQPQPVDIDGLQAQVAAMQQAAEVPMPATTLSNPMVQQAPIVPGVSLPPGLVGEVAQYIYQTAIRPVPEIALAAAIAVCAGVCGRSYNISGTGLNQYLVLLAKTGTGKEGAKKGIDNLIAAVRPQVPMVDQFIGPSAFASGPALIKTLDEVPCFVSVLGEFGLTLQQLCDPRANSAEKTLKRVLLDLYTKSGWSDMLRSSVYSDREKNTKTVQAPNVTILGESTPETFFEGLGAMHIAEGLIPRFSIVEYTGGRPPRNRNANQPPPPHLATAFGQLVAVSLTTANNGTCANVQMNTDAVHLMDQLDAEADHHINGNGGEVERQLWNRSHLKALKLAALVAVGVNPHAPTVTGEIAQWAIDFIRRDVGVIQNRFRDGDVGAGEAKQEHDLRKVILEYLNKSYESVKSYGVTPDVHKDKVIPYDYLRRRGRMISVIANDRRGPAKAIQDMLRDMVAAGVLVQLPPQQVLERYKKRADMYALGESW